MPSDPPGPPGRRFPIDGALIRFLLVGVVNTSVGLGIIYSTKYFLSFGDATANAVGYVVGLMVSFVLNSRWTFRYRGNMVLAAARFVAVFLVAYAANLVVVLGAIHLGANSYLAQAMGVPVYTLTFYAGSRWVAFRNPTARTA